MGDVLGIVDGSGNIIVSYRYNAWGLLIDPWDSNTTTANAPAENNSLLYRGYCYDSELGMYYLQSRFYDPTLCRFVNADSPTNLAANSDFIAYNLYAYCGNNPVSRADLNGDIWNAVIGAVSGAMVGGLSALIMGTDVKAGMISGALSGAISGAAIDITIATGGVGLVAFAAVTTASGVGGSVSSYVNQRLNGVSHADVNWGNVAVDGVWGAIGGAVSFGVADIGGTTAQTLKRIFSQSPRKILNQALSDLGLTTIITAGTWLNGTQMNMQIS